ncbi:hypothetical protein ACL02U_20400 [Streptomyces sp. MS06]|uniref:hypothetical protein n=1 Tax=Streptomyces sp. MS06 TaxID=3385974 RepID=UPI0039A30BE1
MRIRTTIAVATAALAVTLVGCSSDSDDGKSDAPGATRSTGGSAAEQAAGIPAAPTGAERDAVLAAIRDVNAKLTVDEDKAVDAARKQCSALDGGAANPDHAAAQRFSYGGVTLTDDDGGHLNIGLRKTLCPAA